MSGSSGVSGLALVLGLAFVLSLGQLVGCASSGHDENYKMLEEDRPMFETRPDPNKPGASLPADAHTITQAVVLTAPQQTDDVHVDMTPPPNPPVNDGPTPVAEPVTQPDGPTDAQSAAPRPQADLHQPEPTEGDTALTDPQTAHQTREALRHTGVAPSVTGLNRSQWKHMTVGPNLASAYQSSYFGDVDPASTSSKDMAVEPLAFAWDVVALPVRIVMTPPWQRQGDAQDTAANREVHIGVDEWKQGSHAADKACCTSEDGSCCIKNAACCE